MNWNGLSGSNDAIEVSRDGNDIVVSVDIGNDIAGTGPNGDASDIPAFVSRFPAAAISSIIIAASDGNDTISIEPQIGIPITIDGGTHGASGDSLALNLAGVTGGVLVDNGNGTGSFSSSSHAQMTWSNIEVLSNVTAAIVSSHLLFYNNSNFDGNNAAANAADDGAISDKVPLLPGASANFTNYSGYSRGINGIIFDVTGLANTPTIQDLEFSISNLAANPVFTPAPAPVSITRRIGAGVGGADRITVIWGNNLIKNQWLRVRLLATLNTGSATGPNTFYFGNQIGETGNIVGNTSVNGLDSQGIINNPTGFVQTGITNRYDLNRDRSVNGLDAQIVVNNSTGFASLPLFTAPLETVPSSISPTQNLKPVTSQLIGVPASPVLTNDLKKSAILTDPVLITPETVNQNVTGFFPSGPSPYDLNNDGRVDARDVAIAVNNQAIARNAAAAATPIAPVITAPSRPIPRWTEAQREAVRAQRRLAHQRILQAARLAARVDTAISSFIAS